MPRQKKNGTYLNVCIDSKVYDQLCSFCEEAGQTKTIAVERALAYYMEINKKKQIMLEQLEQNEL